MINKYLSLLVIVLLAMTWGCGQGTEQGKKENSPKEKPVITVSVLPQQYFVKRLAGDKFNINVMIPPGHSPATYEPTPQQMKWISRSVIYFRIGHIPFENAWMDKLASLNRGMKIVDTSQGVDLITGTPHSHENEHQHENGDEHEDENEHKHGGIDPHIWLSPSAVKIQAKHIKDALAALDPASKDLFQQNYTAFIREIDDFHRETLQLFEGMTGRKFLAYHPAWSYFARDYRLVQLSIEEEGKSPGAAGMKRVIDRAKQENIRVILVQKQFSSSNARTVANEINATVLILDPLAPDWLENMKTIAHEFKKALN